LRSAICEKEKKNKIRGNVDANAAIFANVCNDCTVFATTVLRDKGVYSDGVYMYMEFSQFTGHRVVMKIFISF
jgi:hypothetical protein